MILLKRHGGAAGVRARKGNEPHHADCARRGASGYIRRLRAGHAVARPGSRWQTPRTGTAPMRAIADALRAMPLGRAAPARPNPALRPRSTARARSDARWPAAARAWAPAQRPRCVRQNRNRRMRRRASPLRAQVRARPGASLPRAARPGSAGFVSSRGILAARSRPHRSLPASEERGIPREEGSTRRPAASLPCSRGPSRRTHHTGR